MKRLMLPVLLGAVLLGACTVPTQSTRNLLLKEMFVRVATDAQIISKIESGVPLNVHDPATGHTPMTMLAAHRDWGMSMPQSAHRLIRHMLEAGADPNMQIAPNTDYFNEGWTGSTVLDYAASNGNTSLVRTLLEYGADPNIGQSLFEATALGSFNITRLLLAAGADINVENEFGVTPLYLAIKSGQKDVVHLLLESGADPNYVDAVDKQAILANVAQYSPEWQRQGYELPDPGIIALVRSYGGHE